MINLLPPFEKEELILENNKRLVIVLGNVFLIALICLALILFALKFYILENISYQKSILDDSEQKYQSLDYSSLKSSLQKYNASLSKVDDFYKKEIYFKDLLIYIFNIPRPAGLYLTEVSLDRSQKDGNIRATILGFSNTRDNLAAFKSSVGNVKKVENVYFPADNWIPDKDINFNMAFDIKP